MKNITAKSLKTYLQTNSDFLFALLCYDLF